MLGRLIDGLSTAELEKLAQTPGDMWKPGGGNMSWSKPGSACLLGHLATKDETWVEAQIRLTGSSDYDQGDASWRFDRLCSRQVREIARLMGHNQHTCEQCMEVGHLMIAGRIQMRCRKELRRREASA